MNFQFEDLVQHVFSKYQIKMEDICLVGSSVLRILNIGNRNNRDVDLLLQPAVMERLISEYQLNMSDNGALQLDDKIEAHQDRFKFMGLSDEAIFEKRLYKTVEGYRILRPEILFCYKLLRRSREDTIDLKALNLYASTSSDWDWQIVWELRSLLVSTVGTTQAVEGDSTIHENVQHMIHRGIRLVHKVVRDPIWAIQALDRRVRHRTVEKKEVLTAAPTLSLQSQLVVRMPTGALFGNQFQAGAFARYDVLLRYLTVKSIAEGDDNYKSLYLRMQHGRVGVEIYSELCDLVASFQTKGFLPYYPIPIKEEGLLVDGAHRLACALYFGVEETPVAILPTRERIDYGRPWFEEHGFPETLLTDLDNTRNMLFEKYGVWFPLLLWPPASQWFDEIAQKVRARFTVRREEELFLPHSFAEFVRQVYAVDDIETWKVELKLHAMREYEPRVRIMLLEVPDPQFRQKTEPRSYLSVVGESLKQWLRSEYNARVPDYFYDIICHISDNHRHNQRIVEIIREVKERYQPNLK